MNIKDSRIKLMNEILNGIKVSLVCSCYLVLVVSANADILLSSVCCCNC